MQVTAEPCITLLGVLRDQLGLTGAKLVATAAHAAPARFILTAAP